MVNNANGKFLPCKNGQAWKREQKCRAWGAGGSCTSHQGHGSQPSGQDEVASEQGPHLPFGHGVP